MVTRIVTDSTLRLRTREKIPIVTVTRIVTDSIQAKETPGTDYAKKMRRIAVLVISGGPPLFFSNGATH